MLARGTVPPRKALAPKLGPLASCPRMMGAPTAPGISTLGTSASASCTLAMLPLCASRSSPLMDCTDEAVSRRLRSMRSPVTVMVSSERTFCPPGAAASVCAQPGAAIRASAAPARADRRQEEKEKSVMKASCTTK